MDNNQNRNKPLASGGKKTGVASVLLIIILAIGRALFPSDVHDNTIIPSADDTYIQEENISQYRFRNDKSLDEHFDKHGEDFTYSNAKEYQDGANAVINNPNSLHKIEAEDGDDVYYLESTNEFVIVSTDGYIRTYFKPSDGIEYFKRQ